MSSTASVTLLQLAVSSTASVTLLQLCLGGCHRRTRTAKAAEA